MYGKQTGSAGTNLIDGLTIRNSMFANKRGATHTGPYYTIDFYNSATDYVDLNNPYLMSNKQTWGGGIRARVWKSGTVQHIPATMLTSGALSATATEITLNTTSSNDSIRVGDFIQVGYAAYNDSDTHTVPEYREVVSRVGSVIGLNDALDYDHPTADVIYVNPKISGLTSDGTEFQGVEVASMTSVYSSRDKTGFAYRTNQRDYYGPATASFPKQALMPVYRACGDEPGNPEAGMLAAVTTHNAWAITDLNGIGMTNFLAYRLNTAWYALPVMREGSATYDPGDIAVGGSLTTTVTVTGAAVGDFALASLSISNAGMTITANVTAADTVSVTYANLTATNPLNLASHTLYAIVIKR
jgi:hypothetical protein